MTNPTLLTLAAILTAGVASAQTAPPLSQILAKLEDQGYTVTSAEIEGQHVEIDAVKTDGAMVEMRVVAATGEILSERADD